MNRRGDFWDNTLALILAAFGIALLVYAGVKLYETNTTKAGSSVIDALEARIDALETGTDRYMIRGAKGWYLAGWGISGSTDERPEKCYFKSCICIFQLKSPAELQQTGRARDACQQGGLVRFFNEEHVEVVSERSYDGRLSALPGIQLNSQLMEFNIDKKKGVLRVSVYIPDEFITPRGDIKK
ncbi:hypothetical protein HYZ97_03760 [Candidatus Pacearchaeota archaeon]|nr:hypothetical protein [Candidatus Pacearchaeota archaeon]